MKKHHSIFLMLLLLLLCGGDSQSQVKNVKADFAEFLSEKPYMGSVKSILYLHGHKKFPSVSGTGSFSLGKVAGDNVTIALVCKLSSGDGFNFAIPGKQNNKSWSSSSNGGNFAIKENGNIAGKFRSASQEITWTGMLFTDRMMLDVKIKYLKKQDNITAGSIIATHLDLYRSVAKTTKSSGSKGCRTIVWENRSVFNLYTGGVDMIRVPVCHD